YSRHRASWASRHVERRLRRFLSSPPDQGAIVMPHRLTTQSASIAARRGAIGGILGALAMAALAMIVMAIIGKGFWTPPKLIAGVVMDDVLMAGAGAVVLGVVIHLIVGAAFGAL